MLVSEPLIHEDSIREFTPRGKSRAIFLEPGDILFMPPRVPSAVVTLEPGTLQAGNTWVGGATTEQPGQTLTAEVVWDTLKLILSIDD